MSTAGEMLFTNIAPSSSTCREEESSREELKNEEGKEEMVTEEETGESSMTTTTTKQNHDERGETDEKKEEVRKGCKVCSKRERRESWTPFDCNICLDAVSDPVVTRCGHLYCWACLYQWLQPGILLHETRVFHHNDDVPQPPSDGAAMGSVVDLSRRCCPVCKSDCSVCTIVPIYVRNELSPHPSAPAHAHSAPSPLPSRPLPPPPPTSSTAPNVDDPSSALHPQQSQTNITNMAPALFRQSSLIPALLGLQQQPYHIPSLRNPNTSSNTANDQNSDNYVDTITAVEDATTEFLSRLLLMLGSFVILCLLLF